MEFFWNDIAFFKGVLNVLIGTLEAVEMQIRVFKYIFPLSPWTEFSLSSTFPTIVSSCLKNAWP